MNKNKFRFALLATLLSSFAATPVLAVDVFIKEELVPVVDQAIFLMDTSSSMNEEFRDTGMTKRELVESEFMERNQRFPDLGIDFGIYVYTDWKEFYPLQEYDRANVDAALKEVTKQNKGPTPLKKGLKNLQDILKETSGRTAVFVFSDGEYTGGNPREVAEKLATDYDICFYVISTAPENQNVTLKDDIASLNACSRLIPLEAYLYQPEYQSGALFVTKATIEGVRVRDASFEFDDAGLKDSQIEELDTLAELMKADPAAYAILSGYTDNTGDENYNEDLSRRRAESVGNYLVEKHGIEEDRIVLHWYGSDNPLAGNDTPEGRAANRRVEIEVGGVAEEAA